MDGTSKKGRGQRGIASCLKKLDEDEYHIEFDVNNRSRGKTAKKFLSWYGLTVRDRISYYREAGKLDADEYYKPLWLETNV